MRQYIQMRLDIQVIVKPMMIYQSQKYNNLSIAVCQQRDVIKQLLRWADRFAETWNPYQLSKQDISTKLTLPKQWFRFTIDSVKIAGRIDQSLSSV